MRWAAALLLASTAAHAQPAPMAMRLDAMRFADSLAAHRSGYDAVTEYERVRAASAPGDSLSLVAGLRIGRTLHSAGRLDDAWRQFDDTVERSADRLDLRMAALIGGVRTNLRRGRLDLAEVDLRDELLAFPEYAPVQPEARYLRGWWLAAAGRYADAAAAWDSLAATGSGYAADAARLAPVAQQVADRARPVDVDRAVRMSALVPGMGLWQAGQKRRAAVAFAWAVGSVAWTVQALRDGRRGEAALIVSLVGLRFYTGNLTNTAEAVRQRNRERQAAAMQTLRSVAPAP